MNESSVGVSTTPDSKRKRSGSSGARGKLWEEAGKNRPIHVDHFFDILRFSLEQWTSARGSGE